MHPFVATVLIFFDSVFNFCFSLHEQDFINLVDSHHLIQHRTTAAYSFSPLFLSNCPTLRLLDILKSIFVRLVVKSRVFLSYMSLFLPKQMVV